MENISKLESILKNHVHEIGKILHVSDMTHIDKISKILDYINISDLNENVFEKLSYKRVINPKDIEITSIILRDFKDKEIYQDILYLRIEIFKIIFNLDSETFIELLEYITVNEYYYNDDCTELVILLIPYTVLMLKYLSLTEIFIHKYSSFIEHASEEDDIALNKNNILLDMVYCNMYNFISEGEKLTDTDIEMYAKITYGRLYMDISDFNMDVINPTDMAYCINALKSKKLSLLPIKTNYVQSHIEDKSSIITYGDIVFVNDEKIETLKRENYIHDMMFNAMYLHGYDRDNVISSLKFEFL